MQLFKVYSLIACFVVLLPGCKRSNTLRKAKAHYMPALNEAKLVDISLPVGIIAYDMKPVNQEAPGIENAQHETVTYFETDFTEAMLRDFYQVDMDRLGWKEVETFVAADETLLLYETPRKIAAISIREYARNKRGVVIFTGARRS